jgi:DinB family protein
MDKEHTGMTPEQSTAATAVQSWTMNVDRADKLFSTLGEAQLVQEVAPGRNRLVYLWGHLIAVHDAMAPLLGVGERLHPELDAMFLTEADKKVAVLPSAVELKKYWDEVHGRLREAFQRFTPADWAQKHTAMSDEDFQVNPLRNRLAVLLNRTNHLSYHLGQAALVPKAS